MPVEIKRSILALILSAISSLVAVIFDGISDEEIGFSNPVILATNISWMAIVIWIIYLVIKKKNVTTALLILCMISGYYIITDYLDFGYNHAQIFYAVEIIFFLISAYYLSRLNSVSWFST